MAKSMGIWFSFTTAPEPSCSKELREREGNPDRVPEQGETLLRSPGESPCSWCSCTHFHLPETEESLQLRAQGGRGQQHLQPQGSLSKVKLGHPSHRHLMHRAEASGTERSRWVMP